MSSAAPTALPHGTPPAATPPGSDFPNFGPDACLTSVTSTEHDTPCQTHPRRRVAAVQACRPRLAPHAPAPNSTYPSRQRPRMPDAGRARSAARAARNPERASQPPRRRKRAPRRTATSSCRHQRERRRWPAPPACHCYWPARQHRLLLLPRRYRCRCRLHTSPPLGAGGGQGMHTAFAVAWPYRKAAGPRW